MSSFVSAVQKEVKKTNNKIVNENGALLNKSTQDSRVDLFNKLVRGVTETNLNQYLEAVFTEADKTKDSDYLADLFVLLFHKRNVRGGEGEKLISYQLFLRIYEEYPKTICALAPLFANYGYFKDYFLILEMVSQKVMDNQSKFDFYRQLVDVIVKTLLDQRQKDLTLLVCGQQNQLSLIGKWMPREGSHFDKSVHWFYIDNTGALKKISLVKYLASLVAKKQPNLISKQDLKAYREGNTKLSKTLQTPEVLMCANQYHLIQFERVASKSMKAYTKAYLNEKLKGKVTHLQKDTGNRFPTREDRVQARKNLREFLASSKANKLKGARLEVYDILRGVLKATSTLEKDVYHLQWESKKKDVLVEAEKIMEDNKAIAKKNGKLEEFLKLSKSGIGNCIPIMDVSGSMCSTINNKTSAQAIDACLALGIMTSELASDPFKNMAISFTDVPTVFNFKEGDTLEDKAHRVTSEHVGYSTNFEAAVDCLLDLCVKNKVPSEEVPNLIVFTDDQFDKMNNLSAGCAYGWYGSTTQPTRKDWNTSHQNLLQKWNSAGYDRVPTIVYWNLRANTPGVQTDANHPGVQLLQGFSPSLLKLVLYGETFSESATVEVETVDGVAVMKTSAITPYETFRGAMDQGCYNPVRQVLEKVGEKLLSGYRSEKFEEVDYEDIPADV